MDIYIIHSVSLSNKALRYAKQLQQNGKMIYVPAKQTKKYDTAEKQFLRETEIMDQNLKALKTCKEVHFMWDGNSHLPIFELGFAKALDKKIVIHTRSPRPIDRYLREQTEEKETNNAKANHGASGSMAKPTD